MITLDDDHIHWMMTILDDNHTRRGPHWTIKTLDDDHAR